MADDDYYYKPKPCPFCGGTAMIRGVPVGRRVGAAVFCVRCGASSDVKFGDEKEVYMRFLYGDEKVKDRTLCAEILAKEAWDRRAEDGI